MKLKRRRTLHTIPELGLTPLIDTALTLLIIFMVTTPMIHNAIKVKLPEGQSQEGGAQNPELVVTIDTSGNIFLNNKSVTIEQIGNEIKKLVQQLKISAPSVWVHIDEMRSCGTLLSIIDRIKMVGGINDVKIALAPTRA